MSSKLISVPEIDLDFLINDAAAASRSCIVDQVRTACREWGFFKIVNHGIPTALMKKVIEAVKEFHEQDAETKKQYCTRDYKKKVVYYSNFINAGTVGSGRDSLYLVMAPTPPDPLDLPHVCRDAMMEYSKEMKKLGVILFELISESLGLNPNHLRDMDCAEGQFIGCNYYPGRPGESEAAIGIQSHTDSSFVTVLLQNEISGLQVVHKGKWIDVPSCPGALIANVGDLMKFITNDVYESVEHRALLVGNVGPRISVAVFFRMHLEETSKSRVYGPIKELLSEENRPVYREAKGEEIVAVRYAQATANTPLLPFRL